ncbi:NSS family neurotransmitter:Na+ symporter [Ereboglobus sp. PH5-10]|uniref:sodium-dependent transporter n=1 Tax=Ereboglobus sp. PH5-10 TaxID=2940629 RepID=UPI002405ADBF|nr:sodium-dependent transporter [Ereboglobus sp. PH5-10]MDF9828623.1 NSS family neurotransmitter:Na+ symporter [Ereboglobus sp. PH5-10]
MARSQWGSRFGFILAAAGSAVGLGAVWKFPYVTATNGGGVFLFIYLAISLTLGLVLMVTEWALGRAAQSGPVGVFKRATKNGASPAWALIGYGTILTCFLILSFYCVVGGWTVAYFLKSLGAGGPLFTPDAEALKAQFDAFVGNPLWSALSFVTFAALTTWIVVGGVSKGIETLSKYLMPVLFLLMLVLIVRGLTLPGATDGLLYYLRPDFSKITGGMLVDAMGLSLFSLSLGMGIMVTYGSYITRETKLVRSSLWVIFLAVTTCFLAGLMVLPPVFAFGFSPTTGPGLTMVTMPAVFAHLPAGSMFAMAFFFLLLVAALTSSVSILEVIVSFLIDEFGWSRRKAAWLTVAAFCVTGMGACLSQDGGWLGGVTVFGKTLFNLYDYTTSNLLMPLGELALAVFAGWVAWPLIETQVGASDSRSVLMRAMRVFLRFVLPVMIVIVMISGL